MSLVALMGLLSACSKSTVNLPSSIMITISSWGHVDATKIEEVLVEGKVNSIDRLLLQKDNSLIVVRNNFTGEGFGDEKPEVQAFKIIADFVAKYALNLDITEGQSIAPFTF